MAQASESVETLKAKIAELEAKIAALESDATAKTPAPPDDEGKDNDDRS